MLLPLALLHTFFTTLAISTPNVGDKWANLALWVIVALLTMILIMVYAAWNEMKKTQKEQWVRIGRLENQDAERFQMIKNQEKIIDNQRKELRSMQDRIYRIETKGLE